VSLTRYRNIVVLTGAGISQAAGLPTYRGAGGLWSDPAKIALADVEAMRTRRGDACAMLWELYSAARGVKPTAAHVALAEFEARLPASSDFLLITQNVDGLHQTAGSRRVCEFHGNLGRWLCDRCGAEVERPDALEVHCGQPMRPAVVLFGEDIPVDAERAAMTALRHVRHSGAGVELRPLGHVCRGAQRAPQPRDRRGHARLVRRVRRGHGRRARTALVHLITPSSSKSTSAEVARSQRRPARPKAASAEVAPEPAAIGS